MNSERGKEMLTFTDWYYQDSKIMKSILDTQGIEIDHIRFAIKNILKQCYVDTATWGLSLWEKELDIKNVLGDYNERRQRIKLYLAKPVSITPEFLTNLVNNYLKDDTAQITEHNKEYWFELSVSSDDEVDWKKITEAIHLYKPAHLGFAVVIRIISQILTKHKAQITQYVNTNHNFWNLGTAEETHWDGVWNFDGSIDWSGIKPDAKYKERQTHLLEVLLTSNSAQVFKINYPADIIHKIASKHSLPTSHEAGSIYYIGSNSKQNIKNKTLNTGKINAMQSRTTGNAKNLWDGSFCWDGSHAWEGGYTLQNTQMENLCTCYSTDKSGNIRKGSFERL